MLPRIDYRNQMRGMLMEKQLLKNIIINTKYLIHSDDFLKRHRLSNGFTRQSKLSFTDIIYFILSLLHNAQTKILFSLLSVNKTFPELFNFLTNSNCFYVFIIFLSTVKFQRETLFTFMFAFI